MYTFLIFWAKINAFVMRGGICAASWGMWFVSFTEYKFWNVQVTSALVYVRCRCGNLM